MNATIRRLSPVGGRKEPLCQGDEARVSRVLSSRYAGMVERLQGVSCPKTPGHNFTLMAGNVQLGICDAGSRRYHIQKFLSMVFAGAILPENFANYRELRVGARSGRWSAATYSDFVPDDTRVRARRQENSRRYNEILRSAGPRKATDFCISCNLAERRMNPELSRLAKTASAAGMGMAHPEANYHVCGGRTVFFEVDRLDLDAALPAALASTRGKGALETLSLIICTELMWNALLVLNKADHRSFEFRMAMEFAGTGLEGLNPVMARLLSGPHAITPKLVREGIPGFVGLGFTLLRDALRQPPCSPASNPSLRDISSLLVADVFG